MTRLQLFDRPARLMLMLVLLPATQLAFAGQACPALMAGDGVVRRVVAMAGDRANDCLRAASPGCADRLVSKASCADAFVAAAKTRDGPFVGTPFGATPVAVASAAVPASFVAAPPGPLPAFAAAPALPVYIRFARFLS